MKMCCEVDRQNPANKNKKKKQKDNADHMLPGCHDTFIRRITVVVYKQSLPHNDGLSALGNESLRVLLLPCNKTE